MNNNIIDKIKTLDIKVNKTLLTFFFSFLFAFITLSIVSKNSYFYVFNDWVDANCFFTVGKSMIKGIVPYKQLFEQKGPLLYLMFGIGSLITPKSFHGVFLLEVLSLSIFNYYIIKILKEFLNNKHYYLTTFILNAIIVSRIYFVQGGSAEEFAFPFIAISLYSFFKYTDSKKYNSLILFGNGLIAGIITMIKYNLLGVSFMWMALLFFYLIYEKKYKEAFISCIWYILGMLTPIAIFSVYFLINDAFFEFINVYFIVNATAYQQQFVLNSKIITILFSLQQMLSMDLLTEVLLVVGVISLYLNKNHKLSKVNRLFVVLSFLMLVVGIFIGGRKYNYYLLPATIYIIFGLSYLYDLLVAYIIKIKTKKINPRLIYSFASFIFIAFILSTSVNLYHINKTKDDYFQYQFAKEISKYSKPTLLNYGWLDLGLYTTSGIYPHQKFFHILNIDDHVMPELRGTQRQEVMEGKPNFLVIRVDYNLTKDEKLDKIAKEFPRYEIMLTKDQEFEGNMNTYYLLKEREYNRILAQE